MKIEKSCNPVPAPIPAFAHLKAGDVFRYGDLNCGPYIKLNAGIDGRNAFDCRMNTTVFIPDVTHVKILPNAKLVTGEE